MSKNPITDLIKALQNSTKHADAIYNPQDGTSPDKEKTTEAVGRYTKVTNDLLKQFEEVSYQDAEKNCTADEITQLNQALDKYLDAISEASTISRIGFSGDGQRMADLNERVRDMAAEMYDKLKPAAEDPAAIDEAWTDFNKRFVTLYGDLRGGQIYY